MPLELPFTSNCPLLLESDFLSLSPSFLVSGKKLHDVPVGAAHKLTPPADVILTALEYGITFRSLCGLADELGIHQIQLADILGFLNSAGALRRRRSVHGHLEASGQLITYAVTGVMHPGIKWRQRSSVKILLRASLRAIWPVEAALGVVCMGATIGQVVSATTSLISMAYGGFILFASVYVHELAHILSLKRTGLKIDIIQSRLRLGIIHRPTDVKTEIKATIAGPICGSLLCVLGGVIGFALSQPVVIGASAIVLSIHVLSLLPMYSDGAVIRAAMRRKVRT